MGFTFGNHTFHLLCKALHPYLVHIIYSSHLMSTMVPKNLARGADWLVVCQTILQQRRKTVSSLLYVYTQTFKNLNKIVFRSKLPDFPLLYV